MDDRESIGGEETCMGVRDGERRTVWRAAAAAGVVALGWCAVAHAAGDPALGEYLSSECVTCHQTSGRQVGAIPAIIGRPADQFAALMGAYKDGQRENQIMRTIAARLSAEEIAALAAYYESLKPAN